MALSAFRATNANAIGIWKKLDNPKQLMAAYVERGARILGLPPDQPTATCLAALAVVIGVDEPTTDTAKLRDNWRKVKEAVPQVLVALSDGPDLPFEWTPLDRPSAHHYLSSIWRQEREAWLRANSAAPQSHAPPNPSGQLGEVTDNASTASHTADDSSPANEEESPAPTTKQDSSGT